MIFMLAVLVGGLFAWIAVQMGFYATWTMFFNILLAAYVAIFLTPVIVATIPAAIETTFGYGYAIVLVGVAIATLLMAYGLCYACLSGRLQADFPKVFDSVGAGLLGFLTGFLISSFVTFAVALTPVSQIESIKPLGLDATSQKTNTSYVCWWCDVIHSLVSFSNTPLTNSKQAVDHLLLLAKPVTPPAGGPKPGTIAPPADNGAPATAPDSTAPAVPLVEPDAKAIPVKDR